MIGAPEEQTISETFQSDYSGPFFLGANTVSMQKLQIYITYD
jgi:hypothetical protein